MTRSAAQRCPSGNCSARKDMSIMFEKLATTILHGKRAFDKASGDDAGENSASHSTRDGASDTVSKNPGTPMTRMDHAVATTDARNKNSKTPRE